MPNVGEKAPDFMLPDPSGKKVKLSDFLGHKVALYFYPKDDTPGCTVQACSLRDGIDRLKKHNVSVVGVSPDNEDSHKKFSSKFNLPFILLADPSKGVCTKYGVIATRTFMGKTFEGLQRTTFLIDEKGIIVRIIQKPAVADHATEILAGFGL